MNTERLLQILDNLNSTNVLVVGDTMLDAYTWCDVRRISPEAPVPVASIQGESYFPGGAANVAHNVRALGARVSLVGVIGDDAEGEQLMKQLDEKGIEHTGVVVDSARPTTLKRRIFSGTQHLLRIDKEVTSDIGEATQKSIQVALSQKIESSDAVILSDYCKGVFTNSIIDFLKEEARRHGKKIFVDSKNKQLLRYSDVYLVKPNKEEAERFAGVEFEQDYSNLEIIGATLVELFKSNVLITLASDGMAFFENGRFIHKPTRAQEVFDVSGAGDTVLATVATAIGAGSSLDEAVDLSNYAAGYVVSRHGTVVCDSANLRKRIGT